MKITNHIDQSYWPGFAGFAPIPAEISGAPWVCNFKGYPPKATPHDSINCSNIQDTWSIWDKYIYIFYTYISGLVG